MVFRGSTTDDIATFITDVMIGMVDHPLCNTDPAAYFFFDSLSDDTNIGSCEVHSGFFKAEQQIKAKIIDAVSKLQRSYPTYKVYVTGHSLGIY